MPYLKEYIFNKCNCILVIYICIQNDCFLLKPGLAITRPVSKGH